MEFLILVGFIALVIGYGWLRGQMVKGLNRSVFERSKHQQGRRLLEDTFVLSVPAGAQDSVIDAVIAELKVYDEPALMARAYATRMDSTSAAVSHGNKMVTNWRIAILVDESKDGALDVLVTTVDATQTDGVVQGIRELQLVHDRIRSAIAKLEHQFKAAP